MQRGSPLKAQREAANRWLNESIGSLIPTNQRGRFAVSFGMDGKDRLFQVYLPGKLPEDAVIIASVRVSQQLELFDYFVDRGAIDLALQKLRESDTDDKTDVMIR